MDVHEIEAAGKGFEAYLEEFSDCFGRRDTASYLGIYVEGQHSDLQRKSAEPIALKAEIPPRSLQVFLRTARWDEERMVDRVQEIVARDHRPPVRHGHGRRIGVAEEGQPHGWGAAGSAESATILWQHGQDRQLRGQCPHRIYGGLFSCPVG